MRASLTLLAALAWASPALAQDQHANHPASPASEIVHVEKPAVVSPPTRPPLLEGYGNGGFAITTAVPEAQAYFSNGMALATAFAHDAAIAAMAEAVRLDPACAMCLWGQAFAAGPTLNFGKDKAERKPLLALAKRAERQARKTGTDREKALIAALVRRYRSGDPGRRDRDFAKAMDALAARYPQDDAIAVLAADAAMVAADGDGGWTAAGKRAMARLEPVLARSPDSTPAIHFYIHASEIAGEGAKAEPHADKLTGLAPNASHLVHMPSHTWYWVGRYQDAANANLTAVGIDRAESERLGHQGHEGVFGLPYHAHNVIFGLGGAMMAEDSQTALTLARPLVEVSSVRGEASPVSQLLAAAGYFALARFDEPAAVLALAEPKLPYLKAAWRYARGEVLALAGDAAGVRRELEAIPAEVDSGEEDEWTKAPAQMLGIVRAVLRGRIATIEGRHGDAAAAFREAAGIEETEDFSRFRDPPAFWYPVRRDLAAALLAAGDAAGARAEAEATLKLRPRDPVTERLLARISASAGAAPAGGGS